MGCGTHSAPPLTFVYTQLLADWTSLNRALRTRVLWVVARRFQATFSNFPHTVIYTQLLADWTSLNRALRPRVLWVVARCMHMPPAPDQKWEFGLRVLHEVLCRCEE